MYISTVRMGCITNHIVPRMVCLYWVIMFLLMNKVYRSR